MEIISDLIEIGEDLALDVRVDGSDFHEMIKIGLQVENDVPNSVPNNVGKRVGRKESRK